MSIKLVSLQGSFRPVRVLKSGEKIEDAPNEEGLDVRVSFTRRKLLPPLTSRGVEKILSPEAYKETYGSTDEDIALIRRFATETGLVMEFLPVPKEWHEKKHGGRKAAKKESPEESFSKASRAVILKGSVDQFSKAFHTELKHITTYEGETFRIREGNLQVPDEYAKIIDSVDGLTNEPFADMQLRSLADFHPAAAANGQGFSPVDIARRYHFPLNVDGTGQTIGIIELGGAHDQDDLNEYFTGLGLHPLPQPVIVGAGAPSTKKDSNGADGEVMLDIEVIGAVAPGAQIVLYYGADASGQGFLDVLTTAIHDPVNRPTILSISWGGPERSTTKQFMDQLDDALHTAAQLGITVCIASGDNGSADFDADDPDWDQKAHVDFPASSPFALACGGTEITTRGEVVWNSGVNQGTGGGVSRYFALPDYQRNALVPNASNPVGPVRRGVPDVAGNASPASGYSVLVDSKNKVIGGTSAAAPLWAGLIALLNQALRRRLGFINPVLYQLADSEAFGDITEGSNGDYSATTGWDACTGLGVPNGVALLAALAAPAAPALRAKVKPCVCPTATAFWTRAGAAVPTQDQVFGIVQNCFAQVLGIDPTELSPSATIQSVEQGLAIRRCVINGLLSLGLSKDLNPTLFGVGQSLGRVEGFVFALASQP